MLDHFYVNTLSSKHIYLLVLGWKSLGFIVYLTVFVWLIECVLTCKMLHFIL